MAFVLKNLPCLFLILASQGTSLLPSRKTRFSTRFHRQQNHHTLPRARGFLQCSTASYLEKLTPTDKKYAELRGLYPPPPKISDGTVTVDQFDLFFAVYGNASGLPALMLHGGPGAGCYPNHARFFDPSKYRIVLLDQRGCGRSMPRGQDRQRASGVVANNTTPHLVRDIEFLRVHLDIDCWHCIHGGSWGTTLALSYAQTYPNAVHALVLRGVCAMRRHEIEWVFGPKGGAAMMDPLGFEQFSKLQPGEDALEAHYDALLSGDPKMAQKAASSWMAWESRVSALAYSATIHKDKKYTLTTWSEGDWQLISGKSPSEYHRSSRPRPSPNATNETRTMGSVFSQPLLTSLYSVHLGFLSPDESVVSREKVDVIRAANVRGIIVQGLRDTICPPSTAVELHKNWPEATMHLVHGAGHSMYDPRITSELVKAIDSLAICDVQL